MATETTTVSLVRHGEVHNPGQIYYGRLPDYALNEMGREQAGAAADYFRSRTVANIYASPMLRTQQTAEIIARMCGLTFQTIELLNEVHSPFDGDPLSVLAGRAWDLYSGSAAKFEQMVDVLERVVNFIKWSADQYPGQHTVGVTHGDLLGLAFLWGQGVTAKDLPEKGRSYENLGMSDNYPAPASIVSLVWRKGDEAEQPQVTYFNPAADAE
jgi:broad specificity phosphatase PhoE